MLERPPFELGRKLILRRLLVQRTQLVWQKRFAAVMYDADEPFLLQ